METYLKTALTSVYNMFFTAAAMMPYLLVGLVVFLGFYYVAKGTGSFIRKVAQRRQRHRNVGLVLGQLAQSLIIFLGLMVALTVVLPNFHPAQLVQFLGISSVAIGFAFRDILQMIR